jgi:hypothetical protein
MRLRISRGINTRRVLDRTIVWRGQVGLYRNVACLGWREA